jgi:hypothetical protein
MTICASGELNLEVLGKVGLHQVLDDHVPVLFLFKSLLQEVDDLVLVLHRDFQLIHVGIVEDEVDSELVSLLLGPDDGLDNIIDDIGIHHKAEAHASKSPGSLDRVVGSNVAVADLAHRVDSPV